MARMPTPGRLHTCSPEGAVLAFGMPTRGEGALLWLPAALLRRGCSVRIGRHPKNEIDLSSLAVSKRHCTLTLDASGTTFIMDRGSSHGTFVNGRRLGANTVSAVRTADTVLAPRRRPFTKVPWLEPRSIMNVVPLASRVSVQWRLDTASEDRSISFFGCRPILTEQPRRRSAAGSHNRAPSPRVGMPNANTAPSGLQVCSLPGVGIRAMPVASVDLS